MDRKGNAPEIAYLILNKSFDKVSYNVLINEMREWKLNSSEVDWTTEPEQCWFLLFWEELLNVVLQNSVYDLVLFSIFIIIWVKMQKANLSYM